MATLLEVAKKKLVGKIIRYGSPGYPMKIKPTKVSQKGKGGFEIDYKLWISGSRWGINPIKGYWDDGHFFRITKARLVKLLKEGEIQYIDKGGAYVEIIL